MQRQRVSCLVAQAARSWLGAASCTSAGALSPPPPTWQQQQQTNSNSRLIESQHLATAWPSQRLFHSNTQLWQSQQQPHSQQQQQQQPRRSDAVLKLYKGKWILPARFLVRGKVFQLLGGGSIGLLLGSLAMEEVTFTDIAALTALAGGMVAGSCCLWYYSRRYVGEMSLMLPDAQRVRFSVLDFWGNREDVVVPISALAPPFKDIRKKEVERLAGQILFPVNVEGDRQYYLSIHAGVLLQPQVFMSLMQGSYDPQDHPSVLEAQQQWQQKMQHMAATRATTAQPMAQQQQQQPGSDGSRTVARHEAPVVNPGGAAASATPGGKPQQQQQQQPPSHNLV